LSTSAFKQRGFSLLEVLVAFTLLAVSMGVMMQALSSNSRGLTLAAQHSHAATLAESLIAEAGVSIPLEASVTEGVTEPGYEWRLNIQENPLETGVYQESSFLITAEVTWGEAATGRRYELSTLRY
jgi:general secretion pathway protein I